MLSDIEISRAAKLKPITEIAEKLGINADDVIPYGRTKAKVPLQYLNEDNIKNSNLILVTAITPNKAGVGKTVTSVALSLGLNHIGKKAAVALREPSLGPCFGMKGGAAGGGLLAGVADGRYQPALYRRYACHYLCQQYDSRSAGQLPVQ